MSEPSPRDVTTSPLQRGASRWLIETAPLVVLAVWTRTRSIPSVLVGDDVVPLDTDSHFHMRRAVQTLANFPSVPPRDALLGWPEGGSATWPPGFDQLCALPAYLLGLRGDLAAGARVIAFAPVLLGVALVLGTRRITHRLGDGLHGARAAAWVAAALCAVLPQAVAITEVGRNDHHGAEALITLAIALWTLSDEGSRRDSLRWELVGAALFAASVHVYCGSVLSIGVALAARAAQGVAWGAPEPRRAWPFAGSGALAAVAGAALLLLVDGSWIASQRVWFHSLYLTLLQPAMMVLAGLGAVGAAIASRPSERPARLRALGLTFAGVAGLCALAAVALPAARAAFMQGLVDWLAHRERWMDSIYEVRPLFDGVSPLRWSSWGRARALAGLATVAMPVLLPLTLARCAAQQRARALLFGAHAVVLVVLMGLQSRFGRPLLPLLCAWTAIGLASAGASIARRLQRPEAHGAIAALALGASAMVALDPSTRGTLASQPEPRGFAPNHEIGLILRAQAIPAVRGAGAGVLAPWDISNDILNLSGRPVVLSGFGPYSHPRLHASAYQALESTSDDLDRWMQAHDTNTLVASLSLAFHIADDRSGLPVFDHADGRMTPNPDYLHARPNGVLWLGGGGFPERSIPHAKHFLPVFATSRVIENLPLVVPTYWIYERVQGAHIVGDLPADGRVTAEVPLAVRGVTRPWIAWSDSSARRFEMVVPMPTSYDNGSVRTGALYVLRGPSGWTATARVTLDDVRAGRSVSALPSR